MQKQRTVDVDHGHLFETAVLAIRESGARPNLRLADEADFDIHGSVVGPARRLQNDLALTFAAPAAAAPGWTVKRTVIAGLVFHAVILGSLAMAASKLIPHLVR